MNRARLIPIVIGVVILLVGAGIAWKLTGSGPPQVRSSGVPAIGGPFQMVDQDGKPVDQRVLQGKWSAVFFGFTFCPDVCPTTLQTMAQAQTQLGPRAKNLQVVFVSVDPGRDTPAQLKTYLSSPVFPKNTLGLTGTPQQVADIAKAYKVYYQKEGEGADYVVNHSSIVYLMDPKGRFNRVLAYGMTPDEMANQIATAMRRGSSAS